MSTIGRKPVFAPIGRAHAAAPFDGAAARRLIAELAARRAADPAHPIRAYRVALAPPGLGAARPAPGALPPGRFRHAGLAALAAALVFGGATLLWPGGGPGWRGANLVGAEPTAEPVAAPPPRGTAPRRAVKAPIAELAEVRAEPQTFETQTEAAVAVQNLSAARTAPALVTPILTPIVQDRAPLPPIAPTLPITAIGAAAGRAAPPSLATAPAPLPEQVPALMRGQGAGDRPGVGEGSGRSEVLDGSPPL